MRIIGYGLMALALFFYVKTIQAIWTLVAESRRLESGRAAQSHMVASRMESSSQGVPGKLHSQANRPVFHYNVRSDAGRHGLNCKVDPAEFASCFLGTSFTYWLLKFLYALTSAA